MYKNRRQAAKKLVQKIKKQSEFLDKNEAVVLGIPRGGIISAEEISKELNLPLDIIVVKKITPPESEELAVGAIGETKGSQHLNERIVKELNISGEYLKKEVDKKKAEIKRREKLYREGRGPRELKNKIVIIVDDGAATGETMIAAAREVWNQQPRKVIVAVPVLSQEALEKLEKEVDEVFFLEAPEMFFSVGQFYEHFEQVDDPQVLRILGEIEND